MTPTRDLIAYLHELQLERLPPSVVVAAQNCVLDTIGCALFGSTEPWSRIMAAEMLAEEGGHALYVFPHKALEQDQLKKLGVFGRGLYGERSLTAAICDGDTPASRRQ